MRNEAGSLVACVALAMAACHVSEPVITAGDTGVDTLVDIWDVPWDPPYDTGHDTRAELDEDVGEPDTGPCTEPPFCPNAPPGSPHVGGHCISEVDCGGSLRCLSEVVRTYDGEVYVSWPGGTCAAVGCNPEDPSTCPSGTTCVHFGSSGGSDLFACIDACKATDTSWNLYEWNCGCRAGYRCDLLIEACLPGCSNDRECCEVWDDVDVDLVMDEGEVQLDDMCTNRCDGDDPEEFPGEDCMASFECMNEGDPHATWQVECLFDSDCPGDARCLNEIHYTDEAGVPHYPGGICIKERCELAGRGCGIYADMLGECVNVGSTTDPVYWCFATCHTGFGPEDGDLNPCRHPSGRHPYTCRPHPPERWFPASIVGNEGLCMPATVPSSYPPVADMCERCGADEDCASPLGLGVCFEAIGLRFCSAWCNESLASDGICGEASTPGGVAPGVCIGLCVCGCDTPEGPLGANGCEAGFACYPNDGRYTGSPAPRHAGDADPAGFCLPACRSSADCASFWHGFSSCDIAMGICH